MNDIKETWFKWEYVCPYCDSHITMTIKTGNDVHISLCPHCRGHIMTLMSVLDVTIYPTTKKEDKMSILENLDSRQTLREQITQELELSYGNQITKLNNEITGLMLAHQTCDYWKAENGRIQSQLIGLVDEYYEEAPIYAKDFAEAICEVIDYQPTKEIEYTATIRVTGRIQVALSDYANSFNLNDALVFDVSTGLSDYDIDIDSYDIEDAEEC